jgi:hypothetical protein
MSRGDRVIVSVSISMDINTFYSLEVGTGVTISSYGSLSRISA